ncbi:MAG TPA: DUF3313 family protein [Rudaea sp.]|jgi:hypothetical protein|nr:DUF3313 family protein [Rudaea sp.]
MKRLAIAWLLAVGGVCTSFAQAPANEMPKSRRAAATVWSEEGLSKVAVKGLDVVYAKPGATLAGYTAVMLGPISVAFRRDWEKQSAPGSRTPIKASDSQRIKDNLSTAVREEVVSQLGDGGYKLVDAPGSDVLDVQMSIIDLDVAAPDIQSAGRVTTFAVSAGEMTLVAALRDSVSGAIVMRIFDRAQARESFRPQRITSVDNAAEARDAARGWAKALRKELDLARTVGTAKP